MIRSLVQWLVRRSKSSLTAVGLVLVLLVGTLDNLTPPAMIFAVFYLPPILFVTWFGGRTQGILVAIASATAWLVVNLRQAPPGTLAFIPYWNAVSGLIVFLALVFLLAAIKNLNTNLESRVEQRTAELRAEAAGRERLEKEILEVSDREQQRISRDLHDGVCQELTATLFATKILEEELTEKSKPQAVQARQIYDYLNHAVGQTRNVARGLHPVKVSNNGLMSALEELAVSVKDLHRLDCVFEADGPVPVENYAMSVHLYRIAQEAVNNAVKHAAPTRVKLGLQDNGTQIIMTIEDNGAGLPPLPQPSTGMGMMTMSYRAHMIGAGLSIDPNPNGGTRVRCTVDRQPKPRAT